jgi:hypothetical protein
VIAEEMMTVWPGLYSAAAGHVVSAAKLRMAAGLPEPIANGRRWRWGSDSRCSLDFDGIHHGLILGPIREADDDLAVGGVMKVAEIAPDIEVLFRSR